MNSGESKNRFISSSEAKEKSRSAYYKLLESVRKGNMVCIRRGVYVTMEQLPEYPLIELHFITESLLELGVGEQIVRGYEIKVYNKERSVCDAIKYRNRVGIDVCSEEVNSYLALST